MQHRRVLAFARPLIAAQNRPVAWMLSIAERIVNNVCELGGVLQAQVCALSRQRMYSCLLYTSDAADE